MILNTKTLLSDKTVQSLWGNIEFLILLENTSQNQVRLLFQNLVYNLHNGIAQKLFWTMGKKKESKTVITNI